MNQPTEGKTPREWRFCSLHPEVIPDRMWGCPDCIVELRRELAAKNELLREALAGWRGCSVGMSDEVFARASRRIDEILRSLGEGQPMTSKMKEGAELTREQIEGYRRVIKECFGFDPDCEKEFPEYTEELDALCDLALKGLAPLPNDPTRPLSFQERCERQPTDWSKPAAPERSAVEALIAAAEGCMSIPPDKSASGEWEFEPEEQALIDKALDLAKRLGMAYDQLNKSVLSDFANAERAREYKRRAEELQKRLEQEQKMSAYWKEGKDCAHQANEALHEKLDAAEQKLREPGYVRVPREPTMGQWDDFCEVHQVPFDKFQEAYRAMIAAPQSEAKERD